MKQRIGSDSRKSEATALRPTDHSPDALIDDQKLIRRNVPNTPSHSEHNTAGPFSSGGDPSSHVPRRGHAASLPAAAPVRQRRILTPLQVADLLGCDDKTITRWARQGYVPAHPIGVGKKKYWRFFEDEIMDWLNDQTNGAFAA